MDLTATLSRVPLFRGLDDADLTYFSHCIHARTLPAGALVFVEGDAGDALYLVADGAVKVFVDTEAGREVLLSLERAGSYFGELSMIDGRPRSASVMTVERTRLLVITRAAFSRCLARRPDVAYRVIAAMANRVRHLTDSVCDLATADVRRRAVNALLRLAEPAPGGWRIVARPSQQEIADMIGASREMTGRVLRELRQANLIRFAGREIVLDAAVGDWHRER